MKNEIHARLVQCFNCYVLCIDVVYYGMSAAKIADVIQEQGNKFVNVLEVRYNTETKMGNIILKEKIIKLPFEELKRRLNNILSTIEPKNLAI